MVRVKGDSAVGGGGRVAVGEGFTFLVTEAGIAKAFEDGGDEGFQFKVEVSGAPDGLESEIGKELSFQNFYGARLFKVAAALCLTNKATGQPYTPADNEAHVQAIKDKQPTGDFDFDEQEAVGREFGADVVMGKPRKSGAYVGQSFPQIGNKIVCVIDSGNAMD